MSVSILGQDVDVMQVPDDPLRHQAELEHQHVLYNKTGEQAVFHKEGGILPNLQWNEIFCL